MKDTSVSLDKSVPCLSLWEGLLPVSWVVSFVPLYWITYSICTATHANAVISLLHFLLFFIAKILERLVHTAVSNSPHLLFECIAVRLSLACLQLYYSVKIAVIYLWLNLMANSAFTLLHPLSVSKLALFTTPSFKTLLSLAPGPTFSWFKLFLHLWYQFFLMFQSLKEVAQDSVLGLSFPAYAQSSGGPIQGWLWSPISMLATPVLIPCLISRRYSRLPVQHLHCMSSLKEKLTLTYSKADFQFSLSSLHLSYCSSPKW